jgi:hypothetical protein
MNRNWWPGWLAGTTRGAEGNPVLHAAWLRWPSRSLVYEAAGWLLLLLGLNVFRISFRYLNQRQVVEAFVAALIGWFIFRGGMQLLKVTVASQALLRDSGAGPQSRPPQGESSVP